MSDKSSVHRRASLKPFKVSKPGTAQISPEHKEFIERVKRNKGVD